MASLDSKFIRISGSPKIALEKDVLYELGTVNDCYRPKYEIFKVVQSSTNVMATLRIAETGVVSIKFNIELTTRSAINIMESYF